MRRSLNIDTRLRYDIEAVSGKQIEILWQFFDESDNAMLLTGYTAQGVVFDESGATILTLTPSVTAASGTVALDQLISSSLVAGRLDYELDLVDSGGSVRPTFYGKFQISKKPH